MGHQLTRAGRAFCDARLQQVAAAANHPASLSTHTSLPPVIHRWWTTASALAAGVPRCWPSLARRRPPCLPGEPPHAAMHAPAPLMWPPPSRHLARRVPSGCSYLRAASMRWTLGTAGVAAAAGWQGPAGRERWSLRPAGRTRGWTMTKVRLIERGLDVQLFCCTVTCLHAMHCLAH